MELGTNGIDTLTTAVGLLLTSPTKITTLREATFSRFWKAYGPMFNEMDDPLVKEILSNAEGVVADIGLVDSGWRGNGRADEME